MLRFASLFMVIFLWVAPVAAQDEDVYSRYRLPESTQVQIRGERHQAFNLGGYKELLRMDNDLRNLTLWHAVDEQRIARLEEAGAQYTLALDEANLALEATELDRQRMYLLWEEENQRRQELENAPDYSWIPWTLAGGLAVSTLVLALIVGVQ